MKQLFIDDYTCMAAVQFHKEVTLHLREKYDRIWRQGGHTLGYLITENQPLTGLYGVPVRVVRVMLEEYDSGNHSEQTSLCKEFIADLKREMIENPAYYTIRIPAQFPCLLQAITDLPGTTLFCGGTVAYAINPAEGRANMAMWKSPKEDVRVFLTDSAYLEANCRKLCKIAEDSFANYSGQYHIAPRTAPKAGQIYTNWIRSIFEHPEAYCMMCVECNGEPAGFSLLSEDEYGIDMELTAVSEQFRGQGLYTELMRENVRYAVSRDRIFVSSTQLDNFGSQRTWAKVGMRPYYTIYNFHCDCLGE